MSFVINGDILEKYTENEIVDCITVPPGVVIIGKCAFWGCNAKTVILPDSLEEISDHAFRQCGLLETVVLPNKKLDRIGKHAFQDCTALTRISDDNTVSCDMIDTAAFCGCIGLQHIRIVGNSIGDGAFNECTGLVSASLELQTSIGYFAFSGCTSLESVEISEDVSIGEHCFDQCPNLKQQILFPEDETDDYYDAAENIFQEVAPQLRKNAIRFLPCLFLADILGILWACFMSIGAISRSELICLGIIQLLFAGIGGLFCAFQLSFYNIILLSGLPVILFDMVRKSAFFTRVTWAMLGITVLLLFLYLLTALRKMRQLTAEDGAAVDFAKSLMSIDIFESAVCIFTIGLSLTYAVLLIQLMPLRETGVWW